MGRPVGRRGESRARLVEAALALFAEHGVSGTSLQMIADALGVTKAAVYHQFPSKSDIVLAVVAPVMEQMTAVADAAEREPTASTRFETALTALVDLVLDNRASAAALRRDPVVSRLITSEEPFRTTMIRIDALLIGPQPDPEARIALALAGGSLMIAGTDPGLADLDRATLRSALLQSLRVQLRVPR